jgi:hypothetical protein
MSKISLVLDLDYDFENNDEIVFYINFIKETYSSSGLSLSFLFSFSLRFVL